VYGALAVGDLLRYTALLLNRVLNTVGSADDFVGHSGEEAFVVISSPARADAIRRTVLERFNKDAVQHYSLGERQGDRVKVKDAAGRERVLPVLKLETAVVN